MLTLKIGLHIITLALVILGVYQVSKSPRNQINHTLGVCMILISLGVFQNSYLLESQAERLNIILILPLNISFLPFLYAIKHLELAVGRPLFNRLFKKLWFIMAMIEISVHLLPLGVYMFIGNYSRPILDFLFDIRKVTFIIYFIFSTMVALKGIYALKKNSRDLIPRHISTGVILFLWVLMGSSVLIGLSVVLPYYLHVGRFIYYLPQYYIGVFLIGWFIFIAMYWSDSEEGGDSNQISPSPHYLALVELLEREKLFRNPNIRISDVSSRLGISASHLSRIIHKSSDDGFNELLNRYRINEVMSKIKSQEWKNKTLVSLGMEAGFNSKSTFQNAFKKQCGKTPSQYKAELEGSDSSHL